MSTCRQCGNELESAGGCSYCLLQLGISHAGPNSENAVRNAAGSKPLASLPSIDELNERFPNLKITRLVGRGGMGAIYHARQTRLDRDVALKIIAREIADDSTFVERFEREAKTLARLSHPNIVTVYDFGHTADGQVYLVMEFVDGINLRDAINSGSIGAEDGIAIVSDICRALQYAHGRGVVHRDIKPENILIGDDGTLKVADFGIAKIIDDSVRTPTLTATKQVLGSLHYLAPEHLESPREVDHRVDLYALGVIFYELLTGQLPLGRYEAPSVIQPNVDRRLDAIVMKLLSRKPDQRFQQATELIRALDGLSALANSSVGSSAEISGQLRSGARESGGGASRRPVSVPFTCEAVHGFAEAVGIVYAKPDRLAVEFRIRDAIWGSLKTQTQTVDIPVSQLTKVELKRGLFGARIVLVTDTISALGNLPNAETGRADLKIKRSDAEMASRVVSAVGFGHNAPHQVSYSDDEAKPNSMRSLVGVESAAAGNVQHDSDGRWTILALLLLCCGTINAGLLSALEFVFFSQLDKVALVTASISVAVLMLPVALAQLTTGLASLIYRPRNLAMAASVVSMLPVAPAWFISFPMGIWSYRWLRREQSGRVAATSPVDRKRGWGATTLMFVRESRWGKFVAAANAAGFLLLISGLFAYRMGFYPAAMEYRVVDSEADRSAVVDAIRQRLGDLASASGESSTFPYSSNAYPENRVRVLTMKSNHSEVAQRLALEGSVQLAWLRTIDSARAEQQSETKSAKESSDQSDTPAAQRHEAIDNPQEQYPRDTGQAEKGDSFHFDVAGGLDLPTGFALASPLGRVVATEGRVIDVVSDFVSELRKSTLNDAVGSGLVFRLSQDGRSALLEAYAEREPEEVAVLGSPGSPADNLRASAQPPSAIGLIADGVLIGFAPAKQFSGRSIEFQLASESSFSVESIMAAVRGPTIPSELERLQ